MLRRSQTGITETDEKRQTTIATSQLNYLIAHLSEAINGLEGLAYELELPASSHSGISHALNHSKAARAELELILSRRTPMVPDQRIMRTGDDW